MFMWLGIKGILSCLRNKHDHVFLVALYGYLLVGTGSFLFHSTLKCKFPNSQKTFRSACKSDFRPLHRSL